MVTVLHHEAPCDSHLSRPFVSVTAPCRPDLLVRAARHYEGAGQVLLRQAVMSSQKFISIGQGELPPFEVWQEVEVPARLDLAGEEIGPRTHNCTVQMKLRIFSSSSLILGSFGRTFDKV